MTWHLSCVNTAHSCSQHGRATPWLTVEWPDNVAPMPKTFTLIAARCLSQCNNWYLYQTATPWENARRPSLRSTVQKKLNSPASYMTTSLKLSENGRSRVRCVYPPHQIASSPPNMTTSLKLSENGRSRVRCVYPPHQIASSPPKLKGFKLSDEDTI